MNPEVICGECGSIVNFKGECPKGHRAREQGIMEPIVNETNKNI